MADNLPLLVFPRAQTIPPPKGQGRGGGKLHLPVHARQVERLETQITDLENDFNQYKGSVSSTIAGLEPETVLVIEIAGSVEKFKQAIDATEGLEWLAEWDIEDIEPNDDFYSPPKIGVDFFKEHLVEVTDKEISKELKGLLEKQNYIDSKGILLVDDFSTLQLPEHLKALRRQIIQSIEDAKMKPLKGRLFVSIGDQHGLDELLTFWRRWKRGEKFATGKTKWRDVFNQTREIRRWGIEETLYETGMVERWKDDLENNEEDINCQIELFYRQNPATRQQTEKAVQQLLSEINGEMLCPFIDMPAIAFHAAKVKIPSSQIRHLIETLESSNRDLGIQLFKFRGVRYFRPTGQTISSTEDGPGIERQFPVGTPTLPPIAAILDGVPNLQHTALRNRVLFDDPDNLSLLYKPGERRHGTAMASLVIHGDHDDEHAIPLNSHVYFLPVMEPDPIGRSFDAVKEYFPDHVFYEDRIERAVRRMFEGEGDVPAQAPTVKIINLSLGDPEIPFTRTLSPWARLLDSLSWKYKVLFCVSAGNFEESIDLQIANDDFKDLSDSQKAEQTIKTINNQLHKRRLLTPAEAINVLTVGALHTDGSTDSDLGQRIDILPNRTLFSPVSRLGHGFRRSVKPEIFFSGGRQLYEDHLGNNRQGFRFSRAIRKPGQCTAYDSKQEGELSKTAYTRGTSNATALATRSGARIYEVLAALQDESNEPIPEGLIAVLIKALLVHGARQSEGAKKVLTDALKTQHNSKRIKKVVTRYLGYGEVDIERVLACTEQRVTVLGSGEIFNNQVHEYRFPLPTALSESKEWRRVIITLAWFTPINNSHRNLREAKLEFQPAGKWKELPLKLERTDTDFQQVALGTVQHEVLEGARKISAYEEDGHILLHVTCKADATESLEDAIPYGIAVTLEVAEGVKLPIYEQVQARIRPRVGIGANGSKQ